MVSEVVGMIWNFNSKKELMQGFQSGFHCVIPSGFKGPAISSVSSVSGIVTYNN